KNMQERTTPSCHARFGTYAATGTTESCAPACSWARPASEAERFEQEIVAGLYGGSSRPLQDWPVFSLAYFACLAGDFIGFVSGPTIGSSVRHRSAGDTPRM